MPCCQAGGELEAAARKPQKPRNRERCQTKPLAWVPREILLPWRGSWELQQPLLGTLEARLGEGQKWVRCCRPKQGQKWVRQTSN